MFFPAPIPDAVLESCVNAFLWLVGGVLSAAGLTKFIATEDREVTTTTVVRSWGYPKTALAVSVAGTAILALAQGTRMLSRAAAIRRAVKRLRELTGSPGGGSSSARRVGEEARAPVVSVTEEAGGGGTEAEDTTVVRCRRYDNLLEAVEDADAPPSLDEE